MRKKTDWKVDGRQLLTMLFGSFLLAFTYYHINFQNGLSEGGFVGLALLGKYLFDLPPALSMIVLDVPIFILALFLKGRKFIVNTLVASMAFSVFYELCEQFSPLSMNLGANLPLAALLSGLLTGFGAGLVIRTGGATGGDDILSMMINQWSGIKIGTVFIMMDAVVLMVSLLYLPLKETLFTIMAVLIAGKMITWTVTYGRREVAPRKVAYGMKKKTARA
ncbi:putative 5xTM membrane YitT family protein [Fontibacillus phaseoli]|uniref:Putative 5xTM membrane YitT family protein n=1 Tax=Fontibacillus phaseoli TaxID=1416533 RepID=A0A369BNG8_9BACL|nr:YitT family protein [Fontibacillus phaseoli]RCX23093.1 putative 5xTM membrane YitT family protein [Fontibacillus phaseoli]